MPRPRLYRRVAFRPDVTYFKPAGISMNQLDEVIITFDELEAVRLKDLQEFDQKESAERMRISQPTFHRLLITARKKIADAIIHGKAIRVEGGTYKMSGGKGLGGPAINCVCSKCGHKERKIRGTPCSSRKCRECGGIMVRGD